MGLISCASLVLLASTALQGASGKVDYGGQTWSAVDAVAYPCDDGMTCVAIAPAAFDRETFLADGVIDSVDLWENTEPGTRFVILTLDAEGSLTDLAANGPDGSTNQHDESMLAAHEAATAKKGSVAGRLRYDADGDRIELDYDVEVTRPNGR